MFILRRITGEGLEINQSIGESYGIISNGKNHDEFIKCFQTYFNKPYVNLLHQDSDDDTKQVYAFLSYGTNIQPLYRRQYNFIMTESGKTFSNESYKG